MGCHADAPGAKGGNAAGIISHGQGAEIIGSMGGVFGEKIGSSLTVDMRNGPQTLLNKAC